MTLQSVKKRKKKTNQENNPAPDLLNAVQDFLNFNNKVKSDEKDLGKRIHAPYKRF